jgi:rRNA maturation protein Nop10
MIGRTRQPNPCDNRNHVRANAPVGHCPQCGGIVNDAIPRRTCSEDEHAASRRRNHFPFCVHCGTRLIRAS